MQEKETTNVLDCLNKIEKIDDPIKRGEELVSLAPKITSDTNSRSET